MRRFFVPAAAWGHGEFDLPPGEAHHARRVLRLEVGEHVVVFDGEGREVEAEIVALTPRGGRVEPCGPITVQSGALPIVLGVGVPRGGRLDVVIRHATELGAAEIRPVVTARSFHESSGSSMEKRLERRERIAREAAKQCRRAVVPRVARPVGLDAFLAEYRESAGPKLALVADEEAGDKQRLSRVALPDTLEPSTTVWLLVGPEGGLERREVSGARSAGFIPVSLGPGTLRVETAALSLLAIVQHRWGDL